MEQEGRLSSPARPRGERVPRPAIGLNACRIEDARVDPDLCQDREIAAEVIVPLRPARGRAVCVVEIVMGLDWRRALENCEASRMTRRGAIWLAP